MEHGVLEYWRLASVGAIEPSLAFRISGILNSCNS